MIILFESTETNSHTVVNHLTWYYHYTTQGMKQKTYKEFMILMTNTVADPGTMVIHSHHTSITNTTMMRSGGSKWKTFVAVSPLYKPQRIWGKLFIYLILNFIPLGICHLHYLLLTYLFCDWLQWNIYRMRAILGYQYIFFVSCSLLFEIVKFIFDIMPHIMRSELS